MRKFKKADKSWVWQPLVTPEQSPPPAKVRVAVQLETISKHTPAKGLGHSYLGHLHSSIS